MSFRRRVAAAFVGVALAGATAAHAQASTPTSALPAIVPAGLTRLLASDPASAVTGIATLDAVADTTTVGRLEAAGLEVQAMKHLPLAIVRGSVASIERAVTTGAAND